MTRNVIERIRHGGLKVNVEKTECTYVYCDQKTIKACEEYKYMGMKITQDGPLDKAIKYRTLQGRRAISLMIGILWDKTISKAIKEEYYP